MIFGRTELRIGASKAKFDVESDFEVRLAVALQKPDQISEKRLKFLEKNSAEKFLTILFRRKILRLIFFSAEKFSADIFSAGFVSARNFSADFFRQDFFRTDGRRTLILFFRTVARRPSEKICPKSDVIYWNPKLMSNLGCIILDGQES